ncbi:Protein bicaudal D isoform 2 [Schistosoma japonicum]|uniref:Protein bicaudal D n=2 Tax=Schistosoma japonicum TaxID=6182 RepID=C1LF35_SCHJA|nr:Protein bicaudal D isoform 2 [Schistosoma japonicum]CAX73313.1 Protein bicaudal D [Schistosoma japonicum]
MAEEDGKSLEEENRQLKSALKVSMQEKYEAAEYGLTLLETNQQLKNQLDELSGKCEELDRELKITRKSLEEQNLMQRRLSIAGFQEEDDLVSESANRERVLRNQVHDLEVELKEVRLKYERQMAENDALHKRNVEQQSAHEDLEKQFRNLKSDIRDAKAKEVQILNEYDDLEAENLELQKTILSLKTSQVEFESVRHELKRLQEENDVIHVQLEEITRLKRMTEKSLEDALESLQIERDQRHNLRKELDSRIISDSISHLSDLRNLSLANANKLNHHTENNTEYQKLDVNTSTNEPPGTDVKNHEENKANSKHPSPDDLLTELRTTEIAKYQAELAHVEAEKNELTRTLEITQRSLELATSEVSNKQERINGLLAQLDAIMSVKSEADSEFEVRELESEVQTTVNCKNSMDESCISVNCHIDENEDPNTNANSDLKRLRRTLRLNENRYSVALRQIASMQHDLWRYHEREKLDSRPELTSEECLKQELVRLQGIVEQRNEEIKTLQQKLSDNEQTVCTNYSKVCSITETYKQCLIVLIGIYSFVCSVIKVSPHKQVSYVADRFNIPLRVDKDSSDNSIASDLVVADKPIDEHLGQECATKQTESATTTTTTSIIGSNFELLSEEANLHLTVVTQLRHLVSTFNEKYSQISTQVPGRSSFDIEETQQQNLRLKSLLETKREQVHALRNVLRANKTTAETALANLKQKYEKEKINVSSTMQQLRNELKTLKEDAAIYASLRAVFAQRYDEYMTQLDEMQRKLSMAEEEKRTANTLLRLAIQQKLAVTQRLEELEVDLCQKQGFDIRSPQPHPPYYTSPIQTPPNSLLPGTNHQHSYPTSIHNQRHSTPQSFPQVDLSTPRSSALPNTPYYSGSSPQHGSMSSNGSGVRVSGPGSDRSKRNTRFRRDGVT